MPTKPHPEILSALEGALIVSCQPVDDGPLDTIDTIVRYALAARNAGAKALRIEGADNVRAVAAACDLPIVGIVKRDLPDSPVRITPLVSDVMALAEAGASIIAVDATDRTRPVSVAQLRKAIADTGCLAMADLSNAAEARQAIVHDFDILGTTLSGYTGGPVPSEPDWPFIAQCAKLGRFTVAEGRFNSPALAAKAVTAGANAVCVGSAITRPEYITEWFRSAIDHAHASVGKPVLAFDIGGTKTLAALIMDGAVLDRRQHRTSGPIGSAGWFDAITDFVTDWKGQYALAGAAVTGVVQHGLWSALNPETLVIPGEIPLADALESRLGVPLTVFNDAQAAAWGEYRYGAGRGRDMVFVTVSSGIGGGIVLNGKLLTGARGLAGSLGQILATQNPLRLETTASGFAIAKAAAELGQPADTYAAFAAAQAGEHWATGILHDSAALLAQALCDLQMIVDPEVMVIGGGIGLQPTYFSLLRSLCADCREQVRPTLRQAECRGDAGILGIADLATSRAHENLIAQSSKG